MTLDEALAHLEREPEASGDGTRLALVGTSDDRDCVQFEARPAERARHYRVRLRSSPSCAAGPMYQYARETTERGLPLALLRDFVLSVVHDCDAIEWSVEPRPVTSLQRHAATFAEYVDEDGCDGDRVPLQVVLAILPC